MKLLIAAGGTAGHFFPARSLISSLEKITNSLEVTLVLTKRQFQYNKFLNNRHRLVYLDINPVSISLNLQNLFSVVKFIKAFLYSFYLCVKFRPDVAIGFGGYASFVVVLASFLNRIPTIIHEQNITPGKANRILACIVDKVSVSFPKTREYFNSKDIDAKLSGNPLRSDLKKVSKDDALEYLNLSKGKFTILVMGGSQGSHRINISVVETIESLPQDRKKMVQIVHLTGKNDYPFVFNKYKSLGMPYFVTEFLDNIYFAYSCCDLVICRAGAMTITEISFMSIASILIPYPHAYGHQKENAQFLNDSDACIMIEEKDLSKDLLKSTIMELIQNPQKLSLMRCNISKFFRPNAADELAKEILQLTLF